MRLVSAVAGLLLLLVAAPSQAQQPRKQEPPAEDLPTSVARRLRQLTGLEARIGELRYELLSSRFVGSDLELGPRRVPLLRIGELVVELTWLSGGEVLKVQRVEAGKVRARLPAAWLERAISPRPHRAARVRTAHASGEVELRADDGVASASGVSAEVRELELPAAGEDDPFRAKGQVTVRVAKLSLGTLVLQRVRLEGKLQHDRLAVDRLEAELLGGKLELRGRVGLGSRRPGPVELRGTLTITLDDKPLTGKVHLSGKNLSALRLEGKLGGQAPGRQAGALKPAPPVTLKLQLGKRELRGTASAWELR